MTALAQSLSTGVSLRDWILAVVGTFVIVLAVFRLVGAWLENAYGRMASIIVAAVVVGGFCFFPNQAITFIKSLWNLFMQG
ncbi:hypothetical protein [Kibdelosporangium phytohabitans]|uniref:Uncharacterized protein n=1 Tax=Kibdelosporangium phytohabitans TaxID=860235 RepID=A0A0N7F2P1_9PSEU|nr:hypothetical protein [Kibdelosporangium phytohabitans]ALG06375.1 hypothetical protein AOZ06_05050 [Kibdelosporangium phytohabitans]MBE1467518.1 hypothetical protein [Kibdelosporangium phytohabitans]